MIKHSLRFLLIAIIAFFLVITVIPLFTKEITPPNGNITEQLELFHEDQPAQVKCPETVGIFYSVESNSTQILQDDKVLILVSNITPWNATIYVNGEYQGKVEDSKLYSPLITQWWRRGIPDTQETADNEQDTPTRTESFEITLKIPGCENQTKVLNPEHTTNAGGSGLSSKLLVHKTETEHIND